MNFKLDNLTFEGPLDLLLQLLHKNKVSIYDIPIAEITNQYIEYVERLQEIDMEGTGEFLVLAAQLLLIKSKMLLPGSGEKEDEGDPRSELVDRLIEYAKYKEAAKFLSERQFSDFAVFYRAAEEIKLPKVKEFDGKIPLSKLFLAFESVMERKKELDSLTVKKEAFETIVRRETVPVKTRIYHIYKRFAGRKSLSFSALFADVTSRAEAVSTFLAVLELMRRGNMSVSENADDMLLTLDGELPPEKDMEEFE